MGADDRTPLHDAADAGYKPVVKLLINEGANLSKRDSNNASPYILAYEKKHKEVKI